jgi:hypothetical protein
MLRRLLVGLFEGLLIGGALGVGAARGLGLSAPGSILAMLLGAGTGFVVGLVAGRPVWARDAKTEALLKAAVGAVGGAGLSLAAGHWLKVPLDLSAFGLGAGPAGALSSVALPLLATLLAVFFELDDNGPKNARTRIASAPSARRVAIPEASADQNDQNDDSEHDEPATKGEAERPLGKR